MSGVGYIFRKISKVLFHTLAASLLMAAIAAGEGSLPATDQVENLPQIKNLPLEPDELSYTLLMHRFYRLKQGLDYEGQPFSDATQEQDAKTRLFNDALNFISAEQAELDLLDIDEDKKQQYLDRLRNQFDTIAKDEFRTAADSSSEDLFVPESLKKSNEVLIPDKPAVFAVNNEDITVKTIHLDPKELSASSSPKVRTAIENYPVLADLQSDGKDILIDPEIISLAAELNHNPVNIFNYVRENIDYEPYFGAKKGAFGCLREKSGSDTDISSLTIALLRAAGIPARYKKSLVYMPVEQLQSFLGVEETKTVFASLGWNKVPVFTASGNDPQDIDTYDFSQETHLAMEWTYVEAFYEYDERHGNFANTFDLRDIETDADLLAELQKYPKKTWISIDAAVQEYQHTQNEIVHDTANFDTFDFWLDFFEYQGDLSPFDKYRDDLLAQTAKDILTEPYQSGKGKIENSYDVLPAALPFQVIADGGGVGILPESWSVLPDQRRYQIKISLKKADDQTDVLSHTFYAGEINNEHVDLLYEGATEADKTTIESYGGIAATPAELVQILPFFSTGYSKYENATPVGIGDSLILEFEYLLNNESLYGDQKFSIAGNSEGIYVVLSKVASNPNLDDQTEENYKSKILLEGNGELARQYLLRVEQALGALDKALDIDSNIYFSHAVVTQSRILNSVNGFPTTYDFKGLNIDASVVINLVSNRGDYKSHNSDFLFLSGLEASYWEAQTFTEIAGLEAISTVKGLQYANANPTEYTLHTINSANESVIDILSLSDNTKANMHSEIQAGNTVITPDKLVEKGAWRGLLYAVYREDGEYMRYAIGEQSMQNGAWTVVTYTHHETGAWVVIGAFEDQSEDERYFVFDDTIMGGKKCIISIEEANQVVDDPGYSVTYGMPCLYGYENGFDEYGSSGVDKSLTFGNVKHKFYLTTKAAKFESENNPSGNYNYWVRSQDVFDLFERNGAHFFNGRFKFDTILGTFTAPLIMDSFSTNDYWTGSYFYEPSIIGGNFRNVNGNIYQNYRHIDRYDKKIEAEICQENCKYVFEPRKDKVLALIGFPISNEIPISNRLPGDFEETYQQFIGGNIYIIDVSWPQVIERSYVTTNVIDHIEQNSGFEEFGYPLSNPIVINESNGFYHLEQDFENSRLQSIGGSVSEMDTSWEFVSIDGNMYMLEFKEGIVDALWEKGLNIPIDLTGDIMISKILSSLKGAIGKKVGKKLASKVVSGVGFAIYAYEFISNSSDLLELSELCNSDEKHDGKSPSYYCGKGAVVSFAMIAGIFMDAGMEAYKSNYGVLRSEALNTKIRLYSKDIKSRTGQILEDADVQFVQDALNSDRSVSNYSVSIRENVYNVLGDQGIITDNDLYCLVKDKYRFLKAIKRPFGARSQIILEDYRVAGKKTAIKWTYKTGVNQGEEFILSNEDLTTLIALQEKMIDIFNDSKFVSFQSDLRPNYWREAIKFPEGKSIIDPQSILDIQNSINYVPSPYLKGHYGESAYKMTLHHFYQQHNFFETATEIGNFLPLPDFAHKWTHNAADGASYIRFQDTSTNEIQN